MARKNDLSNTVLVMGVMEAGSEDMVLRGKSFSITGHLSQPREQVVDLIQNAGGRFDKTPAFGTTYLITNNDWNANSTVTSGASKKLLAAQRNGVKVITERQFLAMLAPKANPGG